MKEETADPKFNGERLSQIHLLSSYGWQICPKCNGQGIVGKPPQVPGDVNQWSGSPMHHECNVCDGKRIISIEYGLPPQHVLKPEN